MPVVPNEHAGPAALLIYCSVLILSFRGGAIGHDGGIPIDPDFDVIRDQRGEIHVPALAVLQVLSPVLDVPVRPVMRVVLIENLFQEGDVRLDDSRIEVLNELCQLALVTGLVAKGRAACREYENCDREEPLNLLFCQIKSDPA